MINDSDLYKAVENLKASLVPHTAENIIDYCLTDLTVVLSDYLIAINAKLSDDFVSVRTNKIVEEFKKLDDRFSEIYAMLEEEGE